MITLCRYHESPLGRLLLAGDERGLTRLHLDAARHYAVPPDWREEPGAFDDLARQLDGYFAGSRRSFEARLAPQGSAFQRAVWQALADIPFGATESYAGIARRVGRPAAARAVGAACRANPIAIVIPCHRVVAADGRLTGYAGGLERKERLLRLEGWLRA